MTIYDIAKEAGVSISTVSRVLNSPEKVTYKTREQVLRVIKKHKYSPNAMARGLVSKSMKTIGILLPDIRNLHFSSAAYVLESMFFSWDYNTILCNTGEDLEKKKKYVRLFSERKVDGLVLLGSVFYEPEIEKMIMDYLPNTPVVTSNAVLSNVNSHSVMIDYSHACKLIIDHLCERGYENIYFVASNNTENTKRKRIGFKEALAAHGMPFNEKKMFLHCDYSFEGALKFAKAFKPLTGKITACIFHDDYLANCACNAFSKIGLSIPEDVAAVGFDNSRFSVCLHPQLTSVDTKIEELSVIVANTLHDIFLGRPVGRSVTISPELIVREST
ncbi:MAG: LacI family DNA-binding transcriptional regulator [Acetivibrionales bacterium]|jgi:LacI family transcriptional regulator